MDEAEPKGGKQIALRNVDFYFERLRSNKVISKATKGRKKTRSAVVESGFMAGVVYPGDRITLFRLLKARVATKRSSKSPGPFSQGNLPAIARFVATLELKAVRRCNPGDIKLDPSSFLLLLLLCVETGNNMNKTSETTKKNSSRYRMALSSPLGGGALIKVTRKIPAGVS